MNVFCRLILVVSMLSVSLGAFAASPAGAPAASQDLGWLKPTIPLPELEARIVDAHPAAYLVYAGELANLGRRDEAVVWLYIGQLRYRFYLASNPGIDPSGDPALFTSLLETIGRPINLYAGGDPDRWAREIDAALRWDASHRNGYTSKTEHARELVEARAGLQNLRDTIVREKAQIKAQREQQGIGTIGVVNGVYVEEMRPKMPQDWPALLPRTTVDAIAGVYAEDADSLLGPTFFFDDHTRNARTLTSVELKVSGPTSLLVVGRRRDIEVLRKRVDIRATDDGITFAYSQSAAHVGLADGEEHETVILRQNVRGELVIERTSSTEGHYPNKPMPVHLTYANWNRAHRAP